MSNQRVPTGIPKLDELLHGGFPLDSMTLLAGPPGSGKTIFSSQFIYNGAVKYGARGVYVSFAETKDVFLRNMLGFGWDFERLEKEKRVAILDLAVTREAGLQSNLDTIMETMTSLQAKRLVIDSFSAISMALKESIDVRVMVHLLYKFLKKTQCVSIMVSDQPPGLNSVKERVAEFLVDGVIYLETYFEDNMLKKRLKILKMRGTDHVKVPYIYEIGKEGFEVRQAAATVKKIRKSSAKESCA